MDRKRSAEDALETVGEETTVVEGLLLSMGMDTRLRPHQWEALGELLAKLHRERSAILALDMGLGKTLTTLAAWLLMQSPSSPYGPFEAVRGPLLVVAGKSEISVWQSQIRDHLDGHASFHYGGTGREARFVREMAAKPFAVLVTYETLAREGPASPLVAHAWSLVVADEVQKIKNAGSSLHRAVRRLRASYRLGLSGTLASKLREIADVCAALVPQEPTLHDHESWKAMTQAQLADFQKRFVVRRTTTVVNLPALHEEFERIVMSEDEFGPYKEAWEECVKRYEKLARVIESPNVPPIVAKRIRDAYVRAVTRLRGIAAHPQLTDLVKICQGPRCDVEGCGKAARYGASAARPASCAAHRREGNVKASVDESTQRRVVAMQQVGLSSKEREAIRVVLDAVEAGNKIIVFCSYTSVLAHLYAHVVDVLGTGPVVYFDGSLSVKQRAAAIDAFQQRPEVVVFMASTTSACRGITLTAATVVVHVDVAASEATVDQACKRAHRMGQTKPVTVHQLVSVGTIDEALVDHVHRDRRQLASRLLSGATEQGAREQAAFSDPVGLFKTLRTLYQEKLVPRFVPVAPVAVPVT